MSSTRCQPWEINDSEFYALRTREEQLSFLLRYAVLAPSTHNTQPWSFRITAEGIDVFADYSRRLHAIDPADRELLMSVGAAITNLRVAAARFGFGTSVVYERSVARVMFEKASAVDGTLARLFPAIRKRRTNRYSFENRAMELEAFQAICDLADRFPDTINLILARDKKRMAELVAIGDQRQMSREAIRKEIAGWIRPVDTDCADGMCVDGLGIPGSFARVSGWLLGHCDLGAVRAATDRRSIENAMALILITADDDRIALLKAGEALELLLLTITLHGLQYSFFNEAIKDDDLRHSMWTLIGTAELPQLVLRVGYGDPITEGMPRRSVEAVLQK